MNSLKLSQEIRNDPIRFIDEFLGIYPHPGQREWLTNATKVINILRPGNKWGKTMSEALMHTWHAMCKPNLRDRVLSEDEWLRVAYQTLVFGPEYEQSREMLKMVVEVVQGSMLIYVCPQCDSHRIDKATAKEKYFHCLDCGAYFERAKSRTNKSLLKDWAIEADRSGAQLMPHLKWFNGSMTLGRSYDEMGKAFKMKALAYITGDECADIMELYVFTTNTLLPRLFTLRGIIHFVGTPQPGGLDYARMIDMAEDDMRRPDWGTSGELYTQKGSVYDNTFIDADYIRRIEAVADPDLRKQIIEGEIVQVGEKYFGFDRVKNMIDAEMKLLDQGLPGRKYLTSVDFSAGESAWSDWTCIFVFDYTEEPWRLVFWKRFKGRDMPIPLQYELVRDVVHRFASRLIIDSSAAGGKNAKAFLRDLHPIPFEAGPTGGHSTKKAEGLGSMKVALDGGDSKELRRQAVVTEDGKTLDSNPTWGLVRVPNIPELFGEVVNYKLDDKKIITDQVMTMMMAIDWLMMRRPKQSRNRAVDLDMLEASIDSRPFVPGYFPYSHKNRAVEI